MHFILSSGWKTQEILFVNIENPRQRIEFQMEDVGSLGYNKRIVKVNLGFSFNPTSIIDTSKIDKSKWKKVSVSVNELNLKFP